VLELGAMAMPIPTEPSHGGEQPASGTRRRPEGAAASARASEAPRARRPSPDEEAMRLMQTVLQRAEVARSFTRLAAGLVTLSAARASAQVRAAAEETLAEALAREGGLGPRARRWVKIARAAKDAAIHVATHRPGTRDEGDSHGDGDEQESDGDGNAPVTTRPTADA
jgi:hypothetical protein